MIEHSDQGITLKTSLAWTILVTFLTGGIWIGVQVTTAKNGIKTLESRQSEDRGLIASNREAIAALRAAEARVDQRLINIERSTAQTERLIQELVSLVRNNGTAQ